MKAYWAKYRWSDCDRKTKEWVLSVVLERKYTKQEIMQMYLNTVSFGNNTYGIKVAAKTYFDKEPGT
jgi:penicillin-binding protein 1A